MSSEPPAKVAKMTNSEVDNANTIPTDKSIAELKKEVQKTANGTNSLNYEYNSISDDENTELKFKKLSENATTPLRASRNAAGFDLFSAEDKTIPAQGHGLVKTDIAIMLPKGTYGRIAPRSSLAYKKFIDLGAGVVDYDYRGNVGVVIFNHFKEPFVVKKGDRIAQLVVEKIAMPALIEVQELSETERGEGGYGSTGR